MKKLVYVVMACLALVFVSCGGSKTPGDVAKSFYENVAAGNYEAAIADFYQSTDATDDETQFLTSLLEKGKAQLDEKGGLKDVQILKETISEDGTTAEVTLNMIFNDGTSEETNESLKLDENGNWKCVIKN
ncbi:MAG: DUF4878 domain-containing protein [Bacteroidales bacterium]|nr:DUF4878 domain-containing protein [Bacteroidales bacterium]